MHSARPAMTSDLSTEIKITASADGVEAGVGRAKRSIADLAQAAATAGEQGGKSMQKIGAGGEAAARTMDGVTKNMVSSLQRQIAALESGGTATRQYQESIARLRGANLDTLKPYLDQLDAARVKAEAAAHSQAGLSSRLGALGGVADVVRGQILALGSSLTMGAMFAFVKRINDGVDALNDIKDATGSTIENISALEDTALRTGASLDLVGSVLIKFNDVLSKATPGSDMALALESIGLKAEELRRLDPAEALRQTAVALSGFADDANKARLIQDLFGKSVKDAAPFLADLAEKGALVGTVLASQADEADRFNKQLFEMQAHATNAARAVAGPLVAGINEAVKAFRDGSAAGEGFWETAWKRYQQNVYRLHGMPAPQGEAITSNPVGGGRGVVNPAFVDPRPSVAPHASAASLAAANTQAKQAAEALRRELAEQAKIMAELHGLSGSFADDWARLSRMYADGALSLDQLTQAQAELLAKQPAIRAAQEAEKRVLEDMAKATLEAAKAREGYIASLQAGADKLLADVQAQQEAADRMGLSRQAVAELDAAKLEMLATDRELQASKELDRNLDLQAYEALMAQAKAYRELANAKRTGAARETAVEEAKKAADEWQRTSDQINQSLTDALMRGFESGKDFAQNLRDTVVNMFKTMVLRPVISAVVNPVAGAITGALGLSTAAQAGQGGGLSTALSGASLLSSFGSLNAGLSYGAQSLFANGLGTTLTAGSQMLGAGSIMGGLGTIAGALGPIALGIGLLSSMFSRKLKDQGIQGTLGGEAGFEGQQYRFYEGGLFRSDKTTYSAIDPELARVLSGGFSAVQDQVTDFAEALSLPTDRIKGFTTDIKVSFKGLDEAGIQKALQDALATGSNELAQQVLGTLTTTTREVTETLAGGMGDWGDGTMQTVTRTIEETTYAASEYAREGEKAIDTLTRLATSLSSVNTIWDQLGNTLLDASLAGADAASRIADAFGGLEAMAATTGTYFQNFYSADEQREAMRRQLEQQFGKLNLTLPDIDATNAREQYRLLAEAQDRSTDEGLKAYAMLLQLSGAFASITQSAEQARESSINAVFGALQRAVKREQEWLQARIDVASEARAALSGLFDLLHDSVQDLYGSVSSTAVQQGAQASAYIAQALATARGTGYLPDTDALSDAISAARGGIDATQYATQFEADRARLVLAGQLSELEAMAGEQLGTAERTLRELQGQSEQLDATLRFWRDQIELSQAGVDATLSVADAIAQLQALMFPELDKPEDTKPGGAPTFSSGPSGGGGGGASSPAPSRTDQILGFVDSTYKDTSVLDDLRGFAITAEIKGWTQADIASAYGYSLEDIEKVFSGAGIPKFAVGTNYVPRDMLAQIHEGEAIIPKAYNPWAGGSQPVAAGSDAELIAELRALRAEVAQLRATSAATASYTAQLADQIDNVSGGGNAVRMEAVA
ncbi:hypothetical protein [Simplicispira sedimenti]|uniref:hypothetical protein n=1 Tax=Simplicispira sedimenti TaxID=2919500 RepID=UPI001FAAFCB0|nr:hypothetical protein [Acidovorax sp. W1-6]